MILILGPASNFVIFSACFTCSLPTCAFHYILYALSFKVNFAQYFVPHCLLSISM